MRLARSWRGANTVSVSSHQTPVGRAHASSPLFFGRRGIRPLFLFPPDKVHPGRRGRSAGRRNVFDSCLAAASLWREARAVRRSIAAISVSEPRFLGRGLAGVARGGGFALSQSSESSSQSGRNAARAESRSLPGACLRGTPAGAASPQGCPVRLRTLAQLSAPFPGRSHHQNASRWRPSTDRTDCI
jgi:hypothetical protein